MPDVAIPRYYPPTCNALQSNIPGDCHGPKGPRNDRVVVTQVHHRCCCKQ